MKFALSDDQIMLRDATRDFLLAESPIDTSRQISETPGEGFSRTHWKKLADLGYLSLTVPEAAGGQGLGAIELAVVLQQMGAVCFPGPFLDVVLAAKTLEVLGGQDARLGAIAAGRSLTVLATADRVWPTDTGVTTFRDGRVQGTKYFVPFGATADRLLVTTSQGLIAVDGPFQVKPMPTLDEARRYAEITLDHPGERIGDLAGRGAVEAFTAIGAAAVALGVCEAAGAMAVSYAMGREAFGKPIAGFQALQHRMADMVVRTESSRAVVFRAAWAFDTQHADAALIAAAAKAYAVESASLIARETVQMHGGNGFTWEYNVHRYLKLATTLEQHYGAQDAVIELALAAVEAGL